MKKIILFVFILLSLVFVSFAYTPDPSDNITSNLTGSYTPNLFGDIQSDISENVSSSPPSVTLMAPIDFYNTSDTTPDFIFNVTDDVNLTLDCTLYINSTPHGTNGSVINGTSTTITVNDSLDMGGYQWYVNCSDGVNNNMSASRTITIFSLPIVLLESPDDNNITIENILNFTFNVTDGDVGDVLNCTLYLDDIPHGTNSSVTNGTSTIITANSTILGGTYNWYINCSDGINSNMSETRTLQVSTPPIINLQSPVDYYNTSDTTPDFIFNITDTDDLPENCTLYINNTPYGDSTVKCTQNQANVSTTCGLDTGFYSWSNPGRWIDAYKTADGDFSTFGYVNGFSEYLRANFSIPETIRSYNGTLIEVKDGEGQENYTIPSLCWGADNLEIWGFSFDAGSPNEKTTWYCLNATTDALVQFRITNQSTGNNEIYDIRIHWDLYIINNTDTTITANATLLDETYIWYINCTDSYSNNMSVTRTITIDTKPLISNINCTSCSIYGDVDPPYLTLNSTPTFTFDTNLTANCRIGSANSNYTNMSGTRNCTSGAGTTSHNCTLINQDSMNSSTSYLYLSCENSITGFETTNATEASFGNLK